jgi:hypothetical protein
MLCFWDIQGSYVVPETTCSDYGFSGLSSGPPCRYEKKKVKCTLVQALRLCTGRTAHRGSRGIALSFHDHSTRRGWGVSVTPRLSTLGKDPVPIVQEAGWAPGPVWTGVENMQIWGQYFKLHHYHFLPHPVQFIVHTKYLAIWHSVVLKLFKAVLNQE